MHNETNATLSLLAREAALALGKSADACTRLADAIDARAQRPAGPPPAPTAPAPIGGPSSRHDSPTASFGRCKGLPLTELDDKDLTWLGDALQRSISDPSKSAYAGKNARDLENIRQEQRRRVDASSLGYGGAR